MCLSIWSVISIVTYLVIILTLASSDLQQVLTLIGFICNLVIIFVGMFCVIWDVLFTKHLSRFSRTFGILTIIAFLFTSVLSSIRPLQNTSLGVVGVTLLWFMSVFLLIYITTRTTEHSTEASETKQSNPKKTKNK
jgi:hypothetical protein